MFIHINFELFFSLINFYTSRVIFILDYIAKTASILDPVLQMTIYIHNGYLTSAYEVLFRKKVQ